MEAGGVLLMLVQGIIVQRGSPQERFNTLFLPPVPVLVVLPRSQSPRSQIPALIRLLAVNQPRGV